MAKRESERRLLKTGEVLKRANVTRQTLYMYTTMGLVEEARTMPSGHRLYEESVLLRLKLIQDLHESGYTLRDIQDIFGPRLAHAEKGSR